jgi:hypothetical protein
MQSPADLPVQSDADDEHQPERERDPAHVPLVPAGHPGHLVVVPLLDRPPEPVEIVLAVVEQGQQAGLERRLAHCLDRVAHRGDRGRPGGVRYDQVEERVGERPGRQVGGQPPAVGPLQRPVAGGSGQIALVRRVLHERMAHEPADPGFRRVLLVAVLLLDRRLLADELPQTEVRQLERAAVVEHRPQPAQQILPTQTQEPAHGLGDRGDDGGQGPEQEDHPDGHRDDGTVHRNLLGVASSGITSDAGDTAADTPTSGRPLLSDSWAERS